MNSRRAEYQDSGSPELRLPMFNQKKRWQPAKGFRPSVEWFALIRSRSIFDLYSIDMCKYEKILQSEIKFLGCHGNKAAHWNNICKIRRLRKPWEAIKTTI